MSPYGGFLSLEPLASPCGSFHRTIAYSNARSCLRSILELLRPREIHLPFYICNAVLDAIRITGVTVRHYELGPTLVPKQVPREVADGALYLLVDYFGILDDQIAPLMPEPRERVILDLSQAFFFHPSSDFWCFNSARKFFGVPDGAYVYGPKPLPVTDLPVAAPDARHLTERARTDQDSAFRLYQIHESSLRSDPMRVSPRSEEMLARIPYHVVAKKRRANFLALERLLAPHNLMRWTLPTDAVPLYYPFLPELPLRSRLLKRRIFVPQLWPEVVSRAGERFLWERRLASHLCPLPIDQRYDHADMTEIADRVLRVLES